MNWGDIAKLIIEVGFGTADAIITRWLTGTDPTLTDWQQIKDMANKTAVDQMKAAITAAGIPLDSAQAAAFLALVK